ncbi:MAG: tol-pal system protein YbgF [Deltaproteobacteria bacterium]|nr:tol-pal system protein YbgF [Candidatus Anaeroferrophillus wilburensis]MBN2890136.1 tol-pal system protein YbgF [Deltaproteobacteria bacterium]
MQRFLVVIVCGFLCLCVSCKVPLDERQEVQNLQSKVSQLEQQLQDLEVKREALQAELQDLRLKVNGIRDLTLKNSQRLTSVPAAAVAEKQVKKSMPAAKPAAAAKMEPTIAGEGQTSSGTTAEMTYQQAFQYYKNDNFEKSIEMFQAFMRSYPQHEMAGNALYWLGENYYSLSGFAQAITEFKRLVQDYPDSKKVPGSLLKIGMSFQMIGINHKAKEYFQQVVEKYPDSNSAAIAIDKLKEL